MRRRPVSPAKRELAKRWQVVASTAAKLEKASPDLADRFRRDVDVAMAAAVARWLQTGSAIGSANRNP